MLRFCEQRWAGWAVLSALWCGQLLAQEGVGPGGAGMMRISDRQPGVPARRASMQHAAPDGAAMAAPVGEYGADCPTGGCPTGGCPSCGPSGCRRGCLYRLSAHFPEHYGHPSKWSVPAKVPAQRYGVEYKSYLPNPAGLSGGQSFPVAYMPTDTTQMGFYYQHVPFWSATNPNPLPPRPNPDEYHNKACDVGLGKGYCWGHSCLGHGYWRNSGFMCRGGYGDCYGHQGWGGHGDCYGDGYGDGACYGHGGAAGRRGWGHKLRRHHGQAFCLPGESCYSGMTACATDHCSTAVSPAYAAPAPAMSSPQVVAPQMQFPTSEPQLMPHSTAPQVLPAPVPAPVPAPMGKPAPSYDDTPRALEPAPMPAPKVDSAASDHIQRAAGTRHR